MNYPHKLLIYLILLTSSLSSITSAYCSTLDSLSILSEIPGADMTVYSLYIENKEKDKEKAADCAELFMSGIDSSAHNIYLARICDYIARWYETDKFLFSKAVSWRLRSLEMYTALNDTYHKALTEHCLAILYFQKGQYHLALRYTDDALDILKTSGTAHDVMNCYMLLGAIYRICGDIPKANEYYTSYVNTAKKINDSLSVAKGMNNIASLSTAPSDILQGQILVPEKFPTIFSSVTQQQQPFICGLRHGCRHTFHPGRSNRPALHSWKGRVPKKNHQSH